MAEENLWRTFGGGPRLRSKDTIHRLGRGRLAWHVLCGQSKNDG